jgi:RNA recognition motif-containing protein
MGHDMNIYVGNLPLELTEDELRQEFSVFGQVKSVSLITDRYAGSRQPRLYGFVEMDSRSEGEAAVFNLKGKEIRGRLIEVIAALPLSDEKDKKPFNKKRVRRFNTKRQPGYQA